MFNFFNRNKVCNKCGVFYTVISPSSYDHLCPTHRQPFIDAEYRETVILLWAERNLDLVEQIMASTNGYTLQQIKEAINSKNTSTFHYPGMTSKRINNVRT